ncbi:MULTISPECIES: TorD/DmsD family molecular chaperone [Pasteurellaceae]|uniref:Molecular chaperone n=1 Tax=Pasteurella atlantica TaxID=2827233 RepID=A0AAW8CI87_9PAST|nr:molecular chaperone [Pasteurella atlantica]MBR0573779.1 molecular chaperone [Pasteurella atlantica]MDP8039715.1 molecular chaperone [Pasteurella atlantica]MDP8041900.1 molecular chaperone [Pasteurella atlantica]MDP8044075.1 molecular chaperone [Pasteurella atlantica]MDP8046053.1 molecular chaperone [Pasteurella atlantica]
MSETTINDFSLLCRLFGNLFYREPTDPILSELFEWLKQGNLRSDWALSLDTQSDKALDTIEKLANPTELAVSYNKLFAKNGNIDTAISSYDINIQDFIVFRQQRGMPVLENPDHVALLLLTASWIEDNLDSVEAQKDLFQRFLLPCASKFLGKVEAFDTSFYKALAQLTRDALSAMADELEEVE